jgi:hypothetical protein
MSPCSLPIFTLEKSKRIESKKFLKKVLIEKKNNFFYEDFSFFKTENFESICFLDEMPSLELDYEAIYGNRMVGRTKCRDITLYFHNSNKNNFYITNIVNGVIDNYMFNHKFNFKIDCYSKQFKISSIKIYGALINSYSIGDFSINNKNFDEEMLQASFSIDSFTIDFS